MEKAVGKIDSRTGRLLAYSVHVYTGLGFWCALMASLGILQGDYPRTFFWLVIAFLIDASDGTLARRFEVGRRVSMIDGRKLDDIVDYLNYTFVPLLLLAGTDWLPPPVWLWVSLALLSSGFAFSNRGAKEEEEGFFRGFPSYWNVFVFYTTILFRFLGSWFVLGLLLCLVVLSVVPVRFIYPSHSPRWKSYFVFGGIAWTVLIGFILFQYSAGKTPSSMLVMISLVYPLSYIALSFYVDWWSRRRDRVPESASSNP